MLYVIINIYINKLPWYKLDNLLAVFKLKKCHERLSIEGHIFLRENPSYEKICSGLPDEFLNIY